MIKLTGLLFAIICLLFFSNSHSDGKILWGEKTIEWEDFKGSPPEGYNTMERAFTTASIEVEYSSLEGQIPKTKVNCYFLKDESWTLINDDYSLGHERLHFDIAEIHARKIRKAFDSLQTNDVKDISKYNDIVELYDNELGDYNYKYDSAVYFNAERQALWGKKTKDELVALEEYE